MNKKTKRNKTNQEERKSPLQSNFDDLELFMSYLKNKKHILPNSIAVYERYEKKLLDWAGNRYLYNVSKIKPFFPEYLDALRKDDGSEYDQDYIKGACSFARRFFEYAYKHFANYTEKLAPDIFDDFSPIVKRSSIEKLNHYTEEDMLKIAALKPKSMNDLRNIAAFLFLYLSGIRIAAFLSLPIKDVFLDEGFIIQDPSNGTYTKLNKSGETILLDCPEIMEVVKQWDDIVRTNCPPESTWFARLDSKHQLNPKVIQYLDRRDPKTYCEARSNYKNFSRIMKALCNRAGIKYMSPHKGRYGNIHKWMETVETMEERQALAKNSLHTLAVLENTYARMSGTEAKSVMRKLANKRSSDSGGQVQLPTVKKLSSKQDSIYLDDLPDYVKQTIITLVNSTGH